MKLDLVERLRCPETGCPLTLEAQEMEAGEVKTGWLTGGAKPYPITRFVPRFVDRDKYASSFSRQRVYVRRHIRDYIGDRSGDRQFWVTTGWERTDIEGHRLLEIGCGYGRFLDVVERAGADVVGVDLSTHSIDLAFDLCGLRRNIHLVQADLNALPFPKATFDRVFSIGVLHHTPDTRSSFEAIVPYAKKGGHISIWVYSPSMPSRLYILRPITGRLPGPAVYAVSVCHAALRGLNNRFWMRALGTFDALSPRFNHNHTPEEVSSWFREAGLSNVRVMPRETAVSGVR